MCNLFYPSPQVSEWEREEMGDKSEMEKGEPSSPPSGLSVFPARTSTTSALSQSLFLSFLFFFSWMDQLPSSPLFFYANSIRIAKRTPKHLRSLIIKYVPFLSFSFNNIICIIDIWNIVFVSHLSRFYSSLFVKYPLTLKIRVLREWKRSRERKGRREWDTPRGTRCVLRW